MLPDLVKRFSCTPLSAILTLNNKCVRVETNHPLVLRHLQVESHRPGTIPETPVAQWRIVVEDEINLPIANFPFYGLAHEGLAFIRIAHDGLIANGAFLAADRQAGLGVSFVATEFVKQEDLFTRHYVPALLLMLCEMGT